MSPAQIRLLRTIGEFRQCERIQKVVWGTLGVASEVLTVTQKYGGLVLGAFRAGRMVGFLYAFLGKRRGRLIHWSHMMAVEPGFRDKGLGFRMKLAHRRAALERGIESICWTYDPLQSRNAALNIGRLGARAEDYLENCYGLFPSRIERGLPSDRFIVNWRIGSLAVKRRLEGVTAAQNSLDLPVVNETRLNDSGFPENRRIFWGFNHRRLRVEIPSQTDAMRSRALSLARHWRLEARKIFLRYFRAGYVVVDFLAPSRSSGGRCFYILERQR